MGKTKIMKWVNIILHSSEHLFSTYETGSGMKGRTCTNCKNMRDFKKLILYLKFLL